DDPIALVRTVVSAQPADYSAAQPRSAAFDIAEAVLKKQRATQSRRAQLAVAAPLSAAPEIEGGGCIAARVGPERSGASLRGSQVEMALVALGDRWSALLLRESLLGARRLEQRGEGTGASRATLTLRLRVLVDEGILHRHPYHVRLPSSTKVL